MGKKLCLIGFNADLERIIKQFLMNLLGLDVEFVFANNKDLQGLVINATLIDSPQIRKFVSTVNVPIVCIHNTHEGLSKATYNKFFSISLQDDDKKINRWLDILLGKTEIESNLGIAGANSSADLSSLESPDALNHHDVLTAIIRHRPVVFYAKFNEMKTWIKPSENHVYIDYQRGDIPPFEFWNFYDSTTSEISAAARPLRLNLWLFETIWQSQINGETYIEKMFITALIAGLNLWANS